MSKAPALNRRLIGVWCLALGCTRVTPFPIASSAAAGPPPELLPRPALARVGAISVARRACTVTWAAPAPGRRRRGARWRPGGPGPAPPERRGVNDAALSADHIRDCCGGIIIRSTLGGGPDQLARPGRASLRGAGQRLMQLRCYGIF